MTEHHGILDVGDHHRELLGEVGHLADDRRELALDVAHQRRQLRALLHHVGRLLDLRHQVGLGLAPAGDPDALGALDQDAERLVGQANHPGHRAEHARLVELLRGRRLDAGIASGQQHDRAVAAQHVVDELDAALLADVEGYDELGERDRLAQRQHGDAVGQLSRAADRDILGAVAGDSDLDHCGSRLSIGTARECGGR